MATPDPLHVMVESRREKTFNSTRSPLYKVLSIIVTSHKSVKGGVKSSVQCDMSCIHSCIIKVYTYSEVPRYLREWGTHASQLYFWSEGEHMLLYCALRRGGKDKKKTRRAIFCSFLHEIQPRETLVFNFTDPHLLIHINAGKRSACLSLWSQFMIRFSLIPAARAGNHFLS